MTRRVRPMRMSRLSTFIGVLSRRIGTGRGAVIILTGGITIVSGMLFASILRREVIPTIYTIVGKNTKRIDSVEIDLNKQLKK